MLMILARLVRAESFWAVVKVRSPHTGPEVWYPREALLDNLQRGGLLQTHAMVRSAIFDHFAYTPHLECAVLLRRRTHCVNRPLWSTDSSNNKKWPSLMCTPRQRGKARYDKRYTVYDNHTL
ncbi:hypothetical protein EMIHUDRAFT_253236 [Emiliania huxleyi CCMP1516]|uniref:Secreted protein n=2 Tax=Emiliania huxleyi TaxID=2903 RepID=A0A0D3I055_EMIH1|nr:hypothetical protein EMIHUDRAFT_220706 [Emiliania huxleyi CCMP1516]XP_005785352.1 hypothetical protein EMIHUDRAFT_253236 [Emiliania huxleyi CCMP1516]EOD04640.1 hypothetical protein EMIHUDRAFT_220706 [Emiliania huxleyi CCMP1516]EOD32923.1 hypothetical protein EMIHUDRAFT_253236 [Emiliania huxleyi CCMP1516]|eukprot:XP_005757069.1 hypothetical protein EMIHUDRAFT_220706 [Emiliania huxleyi CCMP1516]